MSFFAGRVAVLGTKHQKERVIAPILAQARVEVQVPKDFDTDVLGTFSREIPRCQGPLDTARQKARLALEHTNETLGIASEGSFGPHPQMPMLPCDRELVLLIDTEHGLELVGETLSLETNFAHQTVTGLEEAQQFAQKVGFPEHALIVMPQAQPEPTQTIWKGIQTVSELEIAIDQAKQDSPNQTVHLETDMRAMFNPTRQKIIAQATEDLLRAMLSPCPNCQFPGFTLKELQPGLSCRCCGLPTLLPRLGIYRCDHCQFSQSRFDPQGLEAADPSQCSFCNP